MGEGDQITKKKTKLLHQKMCRLFKKKVGPKRKE